MKRSSGKKTNDEALNDTTNQSESEITVREKDENLDSLDEMMDMESYIDELSQQMSTNMAFDDCGSAASSSGNPPLMSKKAVQDSSLPEVCAPLEAIHENGVFLRI